MTGDTISVDTRMGKNRRNEFSSRVAQDTILGGRQVIRGLASATRQWIVHIVVARNAVTDLTDMIIDATGKGTRGVANITIVWSRRHVVERDTLRGNIIVTKIAAEIRDSRGGVVNERRQETLNVMARSAIFGGWHMRWRGRLNDRIYTINHIVAICAGL